MNKYKYIRNPLTNRNVNINSALGKKILKKYVNHMKGGVRFNSASPHCMQLFLDSLSGDTSSFLTNYKVYKYGILFNIIFNETFLSSEAYKTCFDFDVSKENKPNGFCVKIDFNFNENSNLTYILTHQGEDYTKIIDSLENIEHDNHVQNEIYNISEGKLCPAVYSGILSNKSDIDRFRALIKDHQYADGTKSLFEHLYWIQEGRLGAGSGGHPLFNISLNITEHLDEYIPLSQYVNSFRHADALLIIDEIRNIVLKELCQLLLYGYIHLYESFDNILINPSIKSIKFSSFRQTRKTQQWIKFDDPLFVHQIQQITNILNNVVINDPNIKYSERDVLDAYNLYIKGNKVYNIYNYINKWGIGHFNFLVYFTISTLINFSMKEHHQIDETYQWMTKRQDGLSTANILLPYFDFKDHPSQMIKSIEEDMTTREPHTVVSNSEHNTNVVDMKLSGNLRDVALTAAQSVIEDEKNRNLIEQTHRSTSPVGTGFIDRARAPLRRTQELNKKLKEHTDRIALERHQNWITLLESQRR